MSQQLLESNDFIDSTVLNELDNIIVNLESKLISLPTYDFKYIFDCLSMVNNSKNSDLIKTKISNIKMLAGIEMGYKFSQINLRDKNINFNFELNKIDEHLGPIVRSRLVRNMISNNIKIEIESTNTKQIEEQFGIFLELISNEQLNEFPKEWEMHYWLFYNFRNQLKELITKSLENVTQCDSKTLVTHVRVLKGYENKIKEIIEISSTSFTLKLEDSIINNYDNCLISFINELKIDLINKCTEINNLFRSHIYRVPEHTSKSYQLTISEYTEELFSFLGKRLLQCSSISTGESYCLLVQNIMNLIKDHMNEINRKYVYEKEKNKEYSPLIEFVLMNIICTSEHSMKLLETLRIKILDNIQNKYKKNVNDYIDNTRNFISEVFSNSVGILVMETIKRYQIHFDKLKAHNFSEKTAKNNTKTKSLMFEYIKCITDKYVNTLINISGYMNYYCANEISKKLTFDTLDSILNHLLGLNNVHHSHSENFDIIVEVLLKKTSYLMGELTNDSDGLDDLDNSNNSVNTIKKIINGETQVGVMQDGTTITVKLKILTKIAKIRELINAISIKNQEYTEEKHILIFGIDSKIKYETVNTIKGNINIKNVPIVAIGVMGDAVGTVTKPVTNLTMVGVNGLTKMVGMDSSNHSNNSDKKFDDIDFSAISAMMTDAKKMFTLKNKKNIFAKTN